MFDLIELASLTVILVSVFVVMRNIRMELKSKT